jgi:capsular polysaccharide biosynthesis protein
MAPPQSFRALQPSDFSFHGFEHLTAELEETFRDIGIRGDPLASQVVEDAIFVPTTKVPAVDYGPGRSKFVGSLVTRDGQGVDFAQARRRTLRWGPIVRGGPVEQVVERATVPPRREVDEEVVYLGWLTSHFGHFLSESLSRTWFLDEVDPSVKVVFHRKKGYAPSGNIEQILAAFGIPPERLLLLDEPTLLRRVIVPEPAHELHWLIHERAPRRFRQVAERIADGVLPSEQPVYLSRRLLPGHSRQIVGEFEFEEVLRENGFRIAYPETMSFRDQVKLFNQHTDIFTSAGSAAYSVMFSLNQPTLHFTTAEIPRQDYFLLPAVVGAAASYCNCFNRGGRPAIKTTPLLAELPRLVEYLDMRGFLKRRLRASLAATHTSRLQIEFDEAWFCAMVRDVPIGEVLPADTEEEALTRARASWPLTWVLAHYRTMRDSTQVDGLVRQFIDLVCAEHDVSRLARYHDDIESMAPRVVRKCGPDVAARLTSALSERFLVDATKRRRD